MDKKAKITKAPMFAPFNIISMKDIRDKTTKKPGLRPLFGCVESIQAAVDDIRTYLQEGPDPQEAELVQGFLNQLTDMQVKLLEITKTRVQGQNLAPVTPEVEANPAPAILKEQPAPESTPDPVAEKAKSATPVKE